MQAVMDQAFFFDMLAEALVPDEKQATILVQEKAAGDGKTVPQSLQAIVGKQADFRAMNDKAPLIYLITLPAELLHEAVLKLTAQGVTRLKAVEPMARVPSPSQNRG